MDGFDLQGFAIARRALPLAVCAELATALGPADGAGRRGVLELAAVASIARSTPLVSFVRSHVPGEPFAVRAIYFNKSADANWFVSWHQDLTIAVQKRLEVPGFEAWSVKEGVPHVQPPVDVLERMVTLRLHLDAADASNGALRVLPGSHRFGRLSAEGMEKQRAAVAEVVCECEVGDVLLMRPLLVHASGRSISNLERRVLHMEYAAKELPGGLKWHRSREIGAVN